MAVAEYRLLIQETDADKTGQLCEDELIRNIERIAETLEKIERKLDTEKPQIMPLLSAAVSQPLCDNNHGGLALGEKVTLTLTEAALYTVLGSTSYASLLTKTIVSSSFGSERKGCSSERNLSSISKNHFQFKKEIFQWQEKKNVMSGSMTAM